MDETDVTTNVNGADVIQTNNEGTSDNDAGIRSKSQNVKHSKY